MVSLLNIRKYYDRRLALDVPELHLPDGIYWAKGPNGSGKTTLLRIVAGLLPFEGSISVNGVSLQKQPIAYRNCVSWADAEPLFPSFLSGMELIRFYCGLRRSAITEANALTALFEMDGYTHQKISTYSSGMTKKLSLVLAFLGKVQLVILDEPMITLDVQAVQKLTDVILERHQRDGVSFLISSHMDPEAETLLPVTHLTVKNNSVSLS